MSLLFTSLHSLSHAMGDRGRRRIANLRPNGREARPAFQGMGLEENGELALESIFDNCHGLSSGLPGTKISLELLLNWIPPDSYLTFKGTETLPLLY